MDLLRDLMDLFLHLDVHLGQVIRQYGPLTYGILAAIVFCETGLVVAPFLPGDSLLFAAGSLAAVGSLNLAVLAPLLFCACLLGDVVNYTVGRLLGKRLFANPESRVFRREYLERTRAFYAKHGPKTIVLARFVPIMRTFAPFVAGMGEMRFKTYIAYCVAGAILWVAVCAGGGYLFGNIPVVKQNFSVAILIIILISVLPGLIGFARARLAAGRG